MTPEKTPSRQTRDDSLGEQSAWAMFKTDFAASVLADPNNRFTTRIVQRITVVLLAMFGGVFLTSVLKLNWAAMSVLLVSMPLMILAFWLSRYGYESIALFAMATILLLTGTLVSALGHGIRDVVTVIYPGILLIYSLVLNKRAFIVLTGLVIAAVGGLGLAEMLDLFVPDPYSVGDLSELVVILLVLILTAFLAYSLATSMQKVVAQAQNETVERKQAEQKFRSIIEYATDGILVVDEAGRIIANNQRFLEIWNIPSEVQEPSDTEHPWSDDLAIQFVLDQVLDPDEFRARIAYLYEHPDEKSDDELELVDGRILKRYSAPMFDPDGHYLSRIWFFSDITSQRSAEASLRESQQMLRQVIDHLPQNVFWKDRTLTFLGCNKKFADLAGLSDPEKIAGQTDLDMPWADQADLYCEADLDVIKSGRAELNVEQCITHPNGRQTWEQLDKVPLYDEQGTVWAVLGIAQDITAHKQAEEDLSRWADDLRKLYEAALELNAQSDLPVLLQKIVERAATLSGMPMGSLYLVRPDQTIELVVQHNLPEAYLGVRLRMGEGLAGRAVRAGKPMMVEDYQQWVGRSAVFDKIGARRVLSVPLKTRNRVIGTLNFTDTEQLGSFDDKEVQLLSLFTDQAAVAIENARLYQEAQQRAEQLATMNEISRAISTLQDLDSVLEVIYQQVEHIVPVDAFYIALYVAEDNEMSFPIVYDLGVRYDQPNVPYRSGSGIDSVMCSGKPFMLHRSKEDLLTPIESSLGKKDRKSASILLVPLSNKGQVTGVMSVQSYTLNAYTDRHAEILTGIGTQVIIAIENAQLFTARKQIEVQQASLIADLEAKNAELERFTYTVSHDLKSPLITIKGFLGFLEQDALAGNVERLRSDVNYIATATEKMRGLLDDLLDLSRIGRLKNPPVQISASELAQEAADSVAGVLNEHHVHLDIDPEMPIIVGDRVRLREIWENLLSNAAKFMANQPQPRVDVGVRTDQDVPVFYVRDNGIGIAPQYHDRVFGLFEKLDPNSEGTGIGLAIVKRIVETHGGRIWVESDGAGHGTTFLFTLG